MIKSLLFLVKKFEIRLRRKYQITKILNAEKFIFVFCYLSFFKFRTFESADSPPRHKDAKINIEKTSLSVLVPLWQFVSLPYKADQVSGHRPLAPGLWFLDTGLSSLVTGCRLLVAAYIRLRCHVSPLRLPGFGLRKSFDGHDGGQAGVSPAPGHVSGQFDRKRNF